MILQQNLDDGTTLGRYTAALGSQLLAKVIYGDHKAI
jgi:hypothetical protein